MKILSIDIGTGTQDILLLDTRLGLENAYKMVVPSPTMIVRRRIQAAARRREPVLLTGVTMGGGPSHWAVEDHLRAGLAVYATEAAGRSFNDDPVELAEMGITLVSEDEAARLCGSVRSFELKDLDLGAVRRGFGRFGVDLGTPELIAAAVFDHGAAPPGYSDRKFRFEYIEEVSTRHNRLSAFAFRAEDIPDRMTRMQAVAASAGALDSPLMVMDTAPAAICGALLDPAAGDPRRRVVANIGNFHTLAFRLGAGGIEGVFEHHTGMMTSEKLEGLILALANGTLTDADVFDDQGHGARILTGPPLAVGRDRGDLVVTGPRRRMLAGSRLHPFFAAPFGDMMLAGCFGMLSAASEVFPNLATELGPVLAAEKGTGTAPWDF
ncbi:MAG TPA: DUF1786 domain-containing protein [Anaerolineales bacterium]|nr:DUF1786 domain-containing protein [Anaerolineales bacterium]